MNYKIKIIPRCLKELKVLKRKHPNIRNDLEYLGKELMKNPECGDRIPGIKAPLFKIRMASRDQKRGKRGGFRVIYYFHGSDGIIYLITIYAKSKQENFNKPAIIKLIKREGLF